MARRWYPNKRKNYKMQEVSLDDWFISDTHFGHKNIIKYCNRPMNHEQVIIRNWMKVVKPTDTIFHLGDVTVFYGENQEEWEQVVGTKLTGNKKLVMGNHDLRPKKYYASLGFKVIEPFIANVDDIRILFSHYPTYHTPEDNWDLNIHGHSHTHKKKKWSKFHINISVEHMKYSPARLRDILK